jgi:hypothetical protein
VKFINWDCQGKFANTDAMDTSVKNEVSSYEKSENHQAYKTLS